MTEDGLRVTAPNWHNTGVSEFRESAVLKFALLKTCLAVITILFCSLSNTFASDRPNVVMIMTDNHGAWTLGCYGNKDIRTPNIDRLAAEGTLFDNAFASNPVCSPTRATTLTGLIPSQHGVHCFLRLKPLQMGPDARNTLEDVTSLPEILKGEGYRCGLVGKWHLGANSSPQEGLDDYWITMPHGGTSTFYNAKIIEDGKERTEPEYLTDFWTKHAVNFIDQRVAEPDKPFFLFLAYNGPYALSRLLLREGQNRHAEFYRDQQLPSFPREAAHPWQLHNRDYQNNPVSIQRVATEISGVDDGVGTVMEALKANGLDDNTIVIFLADQGWVGGHGGFFGMGDHTQPKTARDGMMKIPLIVRQPGKIAAGRRSQKLVANYDIMNTLLEHLGIDSSRPSNEPQSPGESFANELSPLPVAASATKSDKTFATDDAIFYEFEALRCIRTHDWKYVHRHPNGPHELYDLRNDPKEFNNLHKVAVTLRRDERGEKTAQTTPDTPSGSLAHTPASHTAIQLQLRQRLDAFYTKYAEPRYNLYKDGGSRTIIYDGIEEEIAQQESVPPPPLPDGFRPHQFTLPEGFSSQLIAGPPLVTHPTMGCFDDTGRLFVCDGAGVNMTAAELEEKLPNNIKMLEDQDGDGVFDKSTVFADRMTFPMGAAWHNGALYVASPPNIWRLEDTTGDGRADKREIIVGQFGYTGNAASIHGCFFSPDGRLYWCDGYHGHEFKDDKGDVTSKRKGSYIFSCWPDGSDVRIHCGGGMDNPVEVDFTETGDIIGTVNIMYTRPRIDCLVHWQYGGAYPHREAVLEELKVTGDLLGPIHKFGHVAVSGTTRYRSGVMDHRWGGNFFATEFNVGKVVRVVLSPSGSTYSAVEREFLSCSNRDFHPTDVIEDADGSLLVVDTGGWFYRGCPTSQIARPDVKGGIYRIRRDGMTTVPDPRGLNTDWTKRSDSELMRDLKDTRFAVRERVIQECVRRGDSLCEKLSATATSADILARQNALWASCRIATAKKHNQQEAQDYERIITDACGDRNAKVRQLAWQCVQSLAIPRRSGKGKAAEVLRDSPLALMAVREFDSDEDSPCVRRTAYQALGQLRLLPVEYSSRNVNGVLKTRGISLESFLQHSPPFADREEEHALLYAMIENQAAGKVSELLLARSESVTPGMIIAADQSLENGLPVDILSTLATSTRPDFADVAVKLMIRKATSLKKRDVELSSLRVPLARALPELLKSSNFAPTVASVLSAFANDADFAKTAVKLLLTENFSENELRPLAVAMATCSQPLHSDWQTIASSLLENASPQDLVVFEAAGNVKSDALRMQLLNIASAASENPERRLSAMKGLLKTQRKPTTEQFNFLESAATAGSPAERLLAISIIAETTLSPEQLTLVAEALIPNVAGPQLVELVSLFKRSLKPETADAFLDGIENARAFNSLSRLDLSEVVKRFPAELHNRANALLDRMYQAEQAKLLKVDALVGQLSAGDATRGKDVFFSEKSKCATCHVVGKKGKRIGPDLTTIGASRSPKDLLESIIFPSSTIVRQYEPYTLVTTEGRTYSGLVIKDTASEMTIQQTTGEPVTVRRSDVDELVPATVSIMPKGLDEALSSQQIADLIAWLQTLR